jgi:translation initiation factor IF-1
MTVREVHETIVNEYTVKRKILKAGEEEILVSLMRPRTTRVQVVRQDTGSITVGSGSVTNSRRGSGATIDLPAYENDVLSAVNRTGGLPGLDGINEILIERNDLTAPDDPARPPQVVRIPVRLRDGDILPFHPEDVILKKGDVVFIEARDTEVYYTSGLMTARQFTLPRDLDIRVTEAVAIAGGPQVAGGITQNNFTGQVIATGLGSPSPSRVTVLRRTKNYGQIPIVVDLNRALNDPRENIIIQPGDVIVMQETPGESLTRYLTSVFHYSILGFFNTSNWSGTGSAMGP